MHGFYHNCIKIHADMIRYNSSAQLSIEAFATPFEKGLNEDNRWIKLALLLPWDNLASIYYKTLHNDHGAPSLDARLVIGAMIIKHMEKTDDRGCIQMIQ